jgi:hypothetical protein
VSELTDIKSQIVAEAQHIVSGARRQQYGAPEQNFERIGALWNVWLKLKLSAQLAQGEFADPEASAVRQWLADHTLIDARDVSPLMRLMKEARLLESPAHADSFVDLVGYALTGAEVNGVVLDAPKVIEHEPLEWRPALTERVRVKPGSQTPSAGQVGTVIGLSGGRYGIKVHLDKYLTNVDYSVDELEPEQSRQEQETRAFNRQQNDFGMRAERQWANEKISVAGKDPPVEKGLEVGPARIHVF